MKVRRNISIDPETFDFVMDQALEEGRNFSNMVETIVRRYKKSLSKGKTADVQFGKNLVKS